MKRCQDEGIQYIQKFPKLKKWINECSICHRKGYSPNMPEKITVVDGSLEVYYIKKYFEELPLNEDGICEECAKLLKDKFI